MIAFFYFFSFQNFTNMASNYSHHSKANDLKYTHCCNILFTKWEKSSQWKQPENTSLSKKLI